MIVHMINEKMKNFNEYDILSKPNKTESNCLIIQTKFQELINEFYKFCELQ